VEQFFYLLPVSGQYNLALTGPVNLPLRAGTLILVSQSWTLAHALSFLQLTLACHLHEI